MRLKGISWIEQHFEKVFAGLFGLAAIGVLITQFAGKPSTVKVGTREVPIEDAYDVVVAEAKRVKSVVENPNIEVPTLPAGNNPISLFEKKYRGPIAPAKELAMAPGSAMSVPGAVLGTGGESLNAMLAPLSIPAAESLTTYSYMSTIHPSEAVDAPDVAAILPAQAPFDKASVSVEGRFNGKAMRVGFETDPDGAGPLRAMRSDWWENIQVLASELERQQLQPDGTWSEPTKVPAMPGRFSLAADINQGVPDLDTLVSLRTLATENAAQVRRPGFYDVWMGEEWEPPADRLARDTAARGSTADPTARKMAEKRDYERRLETERARRAEMGPMQTGGRGDPPADRQGAGGGGGKRGAGGGGRPAPAPPGGRQQGPRAYTDADRIASDRRIEDLQRRLAQVNKDLGITDTSADAPAATGAQRSTSGEPSVLDVEDLRIWAHDVTVERGKTYRYRMTLVFNNPLFGRGSVLVPEQAEWARPTLARSEPSAWSDPIEVDKDTYWFITAAGEAGGPFNRGADARAELYQFTMGYWRRGAATIEPGDRVQAEVSVPDVSKIIAMAPADPAAPPMAPPGGGKPGGARRDAGDPNQPTDPMPAEMPMTNRAISTDAILLGVGSVVLTTDTAETRRATSEAFLRMGDGRVEAIRPDRQRLEEAYLKVSRSADAARLAAMPKEQERTRPEPPTRDAFPGRDPAPAPGDGGGGGGG